MVYNPKAIWYIIPKHFYHLLVVIVDVDDSQSHGRISINPHDIVDDIFPVYSRYIASIFNVFDGTLRLFSMYLDWGWV